VEEKLSASGGAGVEDSGATPLTIVIYIYTYINTHMYI
jgi:hypothetical protein